MIQSTRRRTPALLAGTGIALTALAAFAPASHAQTQMFQITLTDLTNSAPNSGQPFSPPVFATHDSSVHLWQAGQAASNGIRQIAEEGNRNPLVASLQPLVGTSILDLQTPLTSPLLPGSSVTFFITADAAHPFLSSAWMLGRTNDGFSGQDSLNLFSLSGGNGVFDVVGLDAGTEKNNEQAAYLIALGGHQTDPENGVIRVHSGIVGNADAPIAWNWSNPVGRVTISAVVPEPGTAGLALTAAGLLPLMGVVRNRRRRTRTPGSPSTPGR